MMGNGIRTFSRDALRVAVSLLAIAFRAAQAYGLAIGFPPVESAARSALPLVMALLFLASGWFMVIAYEKFGPRAFLRSRLIRLGVPLLVSAAIMIPLARWNDVGHLWYLQQLLLFSLGYAAWRWIRRGRLGECAPFAGLPGSLAILAFALVLVALSILGLLRDAFSDLALDLALFIIGAVAAAWIRHPVAARALVPPLATAGA